MMDNMGYDDKPPDPYRRPDVVTDNKPPAAYNPPYPQASRLVSLLPVFFTAMHMQRIGVWYCMLWSSVCRKSVFYRISTQGLLSENYKF